MRLRERQPGGGRITWSDEEDRIVFVWIVYERTLLHCDPDSGVTVGSWFDCRNIDECRERIWLVGHGMTDHKHHFHTRDGMLRCDACPTAYRNGRYLHEEAA